MDDLALVLAETADDTSRGDQRPIDYEHAEEALHLAVTLWALHQQSHRTMDMHSTGYGLGRAVRVLMSKTAPAAEGAGAAKSAPALDEPLRRRFVRVGTAASLEVLGQRLREIVLLLRKSEVPLDYALLADQLYRWQLDSAQAGVRREWGRDFHLAGTTRAQPTGTG
jgi:CRISPR system Cascade subunit CasB